MHDSNRGADHRQIVAEAAAMVSAVAGL